ncbi:MAG: class I SAM-dependent methyltransferase [Candidatus Gracilibacteria bacterium]
MGFLKGKNVLDAGCGSGRIIGRLKNLEANITAIDISEKMLEIVRKKNSGVEVVKGDVRKMPFESGKFDIVIAPFVIVHMKKLDAFFEECYRVLKTGGIFIFTNVNQRKAPKLKIKHHGEICIESYYHIPEQVKEALDSAFFRLEEEKFVYNGEVWINQIIRARKGLFSAKKGRGVLLERKRGFALRILIGLDLLKKAGRDVYLMRKF